MITQKELERIREDAKRFKDFNGITGNLSTHILTLLSELERINRLGTEVREVNLKFLDGTEEKIWPRRFEK